MYACIYIYACIYMHTCIYNYIHVVEKFYHHHASNVSGENFEGMFPLLQSLRL